MRKLVIVLTAALLALAICAAALAENAANDLYNDVADLLFRTNNVTLNATAEFSLDGTWFKTAEGTWKQDMDRSWRQLILRSPKMDGTERRNGYTIVCEGQKIWLMEVFTPGVYRDGSTAARTSILRRSVETGQMIRLAGALAGEANLLLGAGTVITASTKIIDVTAEEPVVYTGRVPARSVVIPGSYTKHFHAGDYQVPCVLIIGQRKESTDKKTSLNEALRLF